MTLDTITDTERLKRINKALMHRVESAMDQQGNAFSLFQTATNLEGRVRRRTDELTATLRSLEQSNSELAAAKEASEVANLSKTRFLAAASHDVLQPLHAAQLSISALADMQEGRKGKSLVKQVERSLDTMNDLLRTLLDISRLDAGVVHPAFGRVHLGSILEGINSDFAPIAAEKGLDLRFLGKKTFVHSDKTMLRRILQNLVSNGLRYTSKGGVLVGVRAGGEAVHIDIVDTGCGIRTDQYDLIFDEFHRGVIPQDHQDGAHVGLGLGLSIVKRMASALGHDLRFTSKEGRGTRFRLTVPRLHAQRAETDKEPVSKGEAGRAYGLSGKRVLLVENDPAVMEAMSALLDRWGCGVVTATTSEEAVASLNDTARQPDIIIADQHLDHGDLGTNVVEHIRCYLGWQVPAVIVTADPTETVEKITHRMGIELMHKPIRPAQLRALVNHYLSVVKSQSRSEASVQS